MKILLIDDSKTARNIIKRSLKKIGFENCETIEADNGPDGISMVKRHQPDLVLCDFNMPGVDGLQVLNELKADLEHMPKFGFVTSEGRPEIREAALEAGALFILQKPFTRDELAGALTSLFGGADDSEPKIAAAG